VSLNIHLVTVGHVKGEAVSKGPVIETFQNYQNISRLYLLCSHEKAIREISNELKLFRRLEVVGIEIDPFDFTDIIGKIIEIHGKERKIEPKANFYVNVTGGTKVMSCAALVGANYIGAIAYYVREDDETSIELTPPKIPPQDLTVIQRKIVKAADKRPLTQTQIHNTLNISVQKVNYNCKSLERYGYLSIMAHESDGRATLIRLTPLGKVALRAF